MALLQFLVLSLCVISIYAATCKINFDVKKPGVFTTKFGSNNIFTNPKLGSITFDDTTTVDGYCATGFNNLAYSQSSNIIYNQVIFSCTSGNLYFKIPTSAAVTQLRNDGYMSCADSSLYYEEKVDHCSKYGLVFGFNVGKTPVVIADVCYDLNTMQSSFIHYIAGIRSSILQLQYNFNPSNITAPLSSSQDVNFDANTITRENKALTDSIKDTIPNYAKIVNYELAELVPISKIAGLLDQYVSGFQSTNMIPWWQPLKYGNWIEVENAIESLSVKGTYDVYAGSSDDVSYSYNGKCYFTAPLTYKVDQFVRSVPLYVWNFVKQRNVNDSGIVIIGVNSPFFEGASNATVICKDVCDSVSWLGVVNKLRKMAALGYVFCCTPNEVRGLLNGFPENY